MNAGLMWLGMVGFFFGFIFSNIAKNQLKLYRKLGVQPDKKYKAVLAAARLLFALGVSCWIIGAVMTMGAG